MTYKTTRQRRQQKTRGAILEAARQIIDQQGLEELSMRSLAEKIDYSPAGLYEYFDGKDEILRAVCQEGHRQLAAAMRQVDTALPPDAFLQEIGLVYIHFALANPRQFLLMFGSNLSGEAANSDEQDSSFPILLKGIQRGIDAGVFKARPGYGAMEMAFAAWSLVHGISTLLIYMSDFPADVDQASRAAMETLSAGFKAG